MIFLYFLIDMLNRDGLYIFAVLAILCIAAAMLDRLRDRFFVQDEYKKKDSYARDSFILPSDELSIR